MGVFTRSRSGKLVCRTWNRQAARRAGGRLISFGVTALELAHVSEPVGAGPAVLNTSVCMKPTRCFCVQTSFLCNVQNLTTGSGNAGTCEKLHGRSRIRLRQKAGVCVSALTLNAGQMIVTFVFQRAPVCVCVCVGERERESPQEKAQCAAEWSRNKVGFTAVYCSSELNRGLRVETSHIRSTFPTDTCGLPCTCLSEHKMFLPNIYLCSRLWPLAILRFDTSSDLCI
jgi:hypothetical protein